MVCPGSRFRQGIFMTVQEKKLLQEMLAERVAHFRACAKHVRDNWPQSGTSEHGNKQTTIWHYSNRADTLEGIARELL